MNALIEDPLTNTGATLWGPDGAQLSTDAQPRVAGCTESRSVEGSSMGRVGKYMKTILQWIVILALGALIDWACIVFAEGFPP
jgi:hypothetical protein